MENDFLELLELQTLIREGIEDTLPGTVRVRAEIASLQHRSNGHCYLELCESGPRGPVAKARAIIWRSSWDAISTKFASEAGDSLHEGISLVFEVRVTYSELYGLSLIIEDIDVGHTLGEAELARRRTIERLTQEGLMDLQKELALPAVPYSIAVISAPDAAGYGDFRRHLLENEYGFAFSVTLFEATMQGDSAPNSIIAALDRIAAASQQTTIPLHPQGTGGVPPETPCVASLRTPGLTSCEGKESSFDAVFLLRGGGSVLDLACFDDYALAAAIAQYPIPVFTAIGHDRDVHVADMVACGSVKTPTALADLCIDAVAAEDERISSFVSRLRIAFSQKISAMEASCERVLHRTALALSGKISLADARLAALQARIAASDPKTILSRGYALVADSSGVLVKSAAKVQPGDTLRIRYSDGTLKCTVNERV